MNSDRGKKSVETGIHQYIACISTNYSFYNLMLLQLHTDFVDPNWFKTFIDS